MVTYFKGWRYNIPKAAKFSLDSFRQNYGGERGIRTPGRQNRSLVFKTSSINHSDISPNQYNKKP